MTTLTPHELAARAEHCETLVPIATRLVAAVHDEGPDIVANVVAAIPDTDRGNLLVVLAAMVDPERSIRDALAWSEPLDPTRPTPQPVAFRHPREHGTARGYRQHTAAGEPPCPPCRAVGTELRAGNRSAVA